MSKSLEIKSWEEYKTEAESKGHEGCSQYGNYMEISNEAFMLSAQGDLMKEAAVRLGHELGIAINENGLRPVEQLQVIVKKVGDGASSPFASPIHQRDTIGVKITAKPTGEREDWARYVYVQAVRAIRAYNDREISFRGQEEKFSEHRIAAKKLVDAGVLTADQAEVFGYSKPWTRQYEHKIYDDLCDRDDLNEDYDPGEAGCDDGQEVEEKKEESPKNDYSTWFNSDFD